MGTALVIAATLAGTFSTAPAGGTAAQRSGESSTATGFTGTWEAVNQPLGPWILNLQAEGNRLAGKVWQEGGLTGPAEIIEGTIDGATIRFRYNVSRATRAQRFFPNLATPIPGLDAVNSAAILRFTLTGTLRNGEIVFTTHVDDPHGVGIRISPAVAAIRASGNSSAAPQAIAREMGILGNLIPDTFSVKRATPAVAGRVLVDEASIPRPVFTFSFVGTNGNRIGPVVLPPPQTALQARNGRFGSPFDPVPQVQTDTLPGNPADFVVRLPAGEYRPTVTGLPDGYVVKSIRSGTLDLMAARLPVAEGRIPSDLTVILGVTSGAPWVRSEGKVPNSRTRTIERNDGNVVVGAVAPVTAITLSSLLFSEFWIAPIRPDGSFSFPKILPGNYQVRAFPETGQLAADLNVPASSKLDVVITAPAVRLPMDAAGRARAR
jgi:hypothetical protein